MTNNFKLSTPVLFLVFKKVEATQAVFNEIRRAKPDKLFIGADGPRENNYDDYLKCLEVKKIFEQIDWDCDVKTLFREKNLGSRAAESGAINWFFDNVERGIILEDDCLPCQSFFRYCQELLDKYRNNSRIMHISGNNFCFGRQKQNLKDSYYFSKFTISWGWATWKRAWQLYDVNMKSFPEFKLSHQLVNIIDGEKNRNYWLELFQQVYDRKIDSWDYQWQYALFSQNGLSIMPSVNLVSNIGFSGDGTYCKNSNDIRSGMKTEEIVKLNHPLFVIQNKELDDFVFKNIYFPGTLTRDKKNLLQKKIIKIFSIIKKIIKKLLPRLYNLYTKRKQNTLNIW